MNFSFICHLQHATEFGKQTAERLNVGARAGAYASITRNFNYTMSS